MFSKILTVALAATAVTAQTFTTCDPTKKGMYDLYISPSRFFKTCLPGPPC